MKKILFVFLAAGLFACNNSADNKSATEDTIEEEVIVELTPEQRLPYKLVYDSAGNYSAQQQTKLSDTATAAGILADINFVWPNVQAYYQKTAGDTVFVTIPDSEYLTQRMGSTGPASYMTLVVYSLTELPGIHRVNFKFEEGDHATPGIYTRADFKNKQ